MELFGATLDFVDIVKFVVLVVVGVPTILGILAWSLYQVCTGMKIEVEANRLLRELRFFSFGMKTGAVQHALKKGEKQ